MKRCIWIRNNAKHHTYTREITDYQYAYVMRSKRKVDGKWTKTWYVHVKPADNPMGFRYMTSTDTLNDAKRVTQLICASLYNTSTGE